MNLQEHLDLLGWTPDHCSWRTDLPKAVIARALSGQAIAAPHAQRIASVLSKEHGLHGFNVQALEPADIDGLQVITPEQLKGSESPATVTRMQSGSTELLRIDAEVLRLASELGIKVTASGENTFTMALPSGTAIYRNDITGRQAAIARLLSIRAAQIERKGKRTGNP